MSEEQINEILKFDPGANVQAAHPDIADEILKFDPVPAKMPEEQLEKKDIFKDYPGVGYFASAKEGEDPASWRQAIVTAFQNTPSSLLGYGIDMARGAGQLLKGAGKMAFSPIETSKKMIDFDYGSVADALIESYKGKYGSLDNFRNALAKDPASIMGDVSTVVMGLGEVGQVAAKMGQLSNVAKVAKTATTVGASLEPFNIARGIAGLPLRLVPERIPIEMYQSAVKFGTTLSAKERLAVTKTAISAKNQIMPTSKGMEKLRGMIDDYNERISTIINNATTAGNDIQVDRLYQGLDAVRDQFKKISDEPLAWDVAFKGIKKQWDESLNIGPTRTPEEVQKIKTRIYKDLESFYEKQKATPAKVELRKAIARNARESLEQIIPEIKQLNKSEGALLELWDAVESKANRITNRDIISIGLPIKMGTGGGIGYMFGGESGGAIGTALGFTVAVFDTPQVKAKIALVMNRLREKGITVRPTTAAIRLGLFQTGKEE